jgi:hypothetical protein
MSSSRRSPQDIRQPTGLAPPDDGRGARPLIPERALIVIERCLFRPFPSLGKPFMSRSPLDISMSPMNYSNRTLLAFMADNVPGWFCLSGKQLASCETGGQCHEHRARTRGRAGAGP